MKNLKPGNKYTKKITIKRILLLLQSDVVWNSKLCLFIRAGELVVSMIRRLNNARRSWSCIRPPPPPSSDKPSLEARSPIRASCILHYWALFKATDIHQETDCIVLHIIVLATTKNHFTSNLVLRLNSLFCQDCQEKTQRQEKPFERPTSFKGLARDERDNDERLCNDYYSKKPLTHGRCDTWG